MKESLQVQWHSMEGSWPTEKTLAGFRTGTNDFMDACQKLSKQLLSVLAVALKLPEDIFTKASFKPLCQCGHRDIMLLANIIALCWY